MAWEPLVSDLKRLRNARAAARGGKVKWLFRYTNLTAAVFLLSSFAFYLIVTALFRLLYAVPYLNDALFLIRFVPLGLAILYTAAKDEWRTFKEKYLDAFLKPMGEARKYWTQDGKPLQNEDSQEKPTAKRFSIFQTRQMLQELSNGERSKFVTPALAFLIAYAVLVILFGLPIFADFLRNLYKLALGMYAGLFGAFFWHDPEAVAAGVRNMQSAIFAHALDALFLFLLCWGVFLSLSVIVYVIVTLRRRKRKIRFFNLGGETPEKKDGD